MVLERGAQQRALVLDVDGTLADTAYLAAAAAAVCETPGDPIAQLG